MKTTFKVEGLAELGRRMRALGEDVEKKIKFQATLAGAGVVRKAVKLAAPVAEEPYRVDGQIIQPGNIGKNVVTKRVKTEPGTAGYGVTVRHKGGSVVGQPYRAAIFKEFGTVKQSPEPFFRPAWEQSKQNALAAIVKRLRQRIEKAEKGQ